MRARVAIHGTNIEALTGDETFRIPIARCSLSRNGTKIVARDDQGSLVIWSNDEAFLDNLARAQRGTLKGQVERLRAAAWRRRVLMSLAKGLIAMAVLFVVSVPFLRWAIRGGIPAIVDGLGQSALTQLALPVGVAPAVEQELATIADQIRPACSPSMQSYRVLLAGYTDVHSFGMPPDTVVVTAGLVCSAEDPNLVKAAIARELAHLESRDTSQYIAEGVDWDMPLDLMLGDITKLRYRMLDFADAKRFPGFSQEEQAVAGERALATLARANIALASGEELASLMVKLNQLSSSLGEDGRPQRVAGEDETSDWAKVRDEACELIGN